MKSVGSNGGGCRSKPYPKLMESDFSGDIYLMFTKTTGARVLAKTNKANYPVGVYCANLCGSEGYIDYNGSVCLEND